MSAHAVAARGAENDGTVVLVCNADGCDTRFTIDSFGITTTREHAAAVGWRAASPGDRRDFCPDHIGEVTP